MTGEVSVEDQTRAGGGLGVQRAAAGRWAILDIETVSMAMVGGMEFPDDFLTEVKVNPSSGTG